MQQTFTQAYKEWEATWIDGPPDYPLPKKIKKEEPDDTDDYFDDPRLDYVHPGY
jgi:hypothetical protein